ncbi:hypothetical protein CA984_00685 [Streptosporangium minutum]|uniref:Uncharacterized protein n=1 Tax=Streptosporangium minutum TaxID=569862 RepID=A0A243RXW3_9ACTN|nr:hypothetical protein CA984_00685 [Streptosporangium minutum]
MFHLREFLRQEPLSGRYPQMIMRLGRTSGDSEGVRRPVTDLLEERRPNGAPPSRRGGTPVRGAATSSGGRPRWTRRPRSIPLWRRGRRDPRRSS